MKIAPARITSFRGAKRRRGNRRMLQMQPTQPQGGVWMCHLIWGSGVEHESSTRRLLLNWFPSGVKTVTGLLNTRPALRRTHVTAQWAGSCSLPRQRTTAHPPLQEVPSQTWKGDYRYFYFTPLRPKAAPVSWIDEIGSKVLQWWLSKLNTLTLGHHLFTHVIQRGYRPTLSNKLQSSSLHLKKTNIKLKLPKRMNTKWQNK